MNASGDGQLALDEGGHPRVSVQIRGLVELPLKHTLPFEMLSKYTPVHDLMLKVWH